MAIFSIPSFMAIASAVLKPIPRTSSVSSIRALGHDHGVRAIGLEDASNESPLTNLIWAHLKKMGSSALPIGGAAVDGLLYNEATTLRRSSFRTTLITNGLLNAAGVFACTLLTPAMPVLAIVALRFAMETSVRRDPVQIFGTSVAQLVGWRKLCKGRDSRRRRGTATPMRWPAPMRVRQARTE